MASPPESIVDSSKASPASLPSVDRVLAFAGLASTLAIHGRAFVLAEVRAALTELRAAAREGTLATAALDEGPLVAAIVERIARRTAPRLRRVFNLTGTVVHTNLGRAPLPEEAVRAAVLAMRNPCNLEFDLATGGRGDRDDVVAGADQRAHRVRGCHRREQQRGGGAHCAQHARARQGSRDCARGADRDRRRVPHARHHGARRLPPARDRHHQPHAPCGLRRGHRSEDRPDPEGPRQQLCRDGLHRDRRRSGARRTRSRQGRALHGRSGQRCARGPVALGPSARAHAAGNARAWRIGGHLQRRQAARRPAGRDHRRDARHRSPHQEEPAEARAARGQDDARSARGCARALSRPGSVGRAAHDAAPAYAASGRNPRGGRARAARSGEGARRNRRPSTSRRAQARSAAARSRSSGCRARPLSCVRSKAAAVRARHSTASRPPFARCRSRCWGAWPTEPCGSTCAASRTRRHS